MFVELANQIMVHIVMNKKVYVPSKDVAMIASMNLCMLVSTITSITRTMLICMVIVG